MMDRSIVIGIDGGGSQTRVMAVDLSGHVLAYSQAGSANLHKDSNAKLHVRTAITEVLSNTNRNVEDIVSLTAGIAGLDGSEDQLWADDFIDLTGMTGKKIAVSDAWIAQVGALGGIPGIIAISGTGSVVFGINEIGEQLRNYNFLQYAYSTARHLSYEMVHRIIAGEYSFEDTALVSQVLEYWGVSDLHELSILASEGFIPDTQECNRKFGSMGPLVTDAAESGIPLAADVCNTTVHQLVTAIRLVGSRFSSDNVNVSLIGSVARSRYMKRCLEHALSNESRQRKSYVVREPVYSPVTGAVLMAFQHSGIKVSGEMSRNLGLSQREQFQLESYGIDYL